MEAPSALLEEAAHRLSVADHMLTMTYPLVKDPKLLLAVLENLHRSSDAALGAFALEEREHKRIPFVPLSTFEDRHAAVSRYLAEKPGIPHDLLRALQEMKELLAEHKTSPVEFTRNDQYVMCDEKYRVKTLGLDDLKGYLKRTKGLVSLVQAKVCA